MARVSVHIKYIAELNNAVARVMVMETDDHKISFPIIIAEAEALSLVKELDSVRVKRPQTHDLMEELMNGFGIALQEVYIHSFSEGVFYTEMRCLSGEKEVSLDSRASDAVIMALKQQCPIFVDSSVLERVGLPSASLGNEEAEVAAMDSDLVPAAGDYSSKSQKELASLLRDAIETEDYELATVIRDELNSRRQKKTDD